MKNTEAVKLLDIYTDGASRGNPGPSAWAYIFVVGNEIIYKNSKFIGFNTNNQTEYFAIIEALKTAIKFKFKEIRIFSDSELVIKQLNGEYKVKNINLQILFSQVDKLKTKFSKITFIHVFRDNSWMKIADSFCNEVLDSKKR